MIIPILIIVSAILGVAWNRALFSLLPKPKPYPASWTVGKFTASSDIGRGELLIMNPDGSVRPASDYEAVEFFNPFSLEEVER
jgi:hypothetical protein